MIDLGPVNRGRQTTGISEQSLRTMRTLLQEMGLIDPNIPVKHDLLFFKGVANDLGEVDCFVSKKVSKENVEIAHGNSIGCILEAMTMHSIFDLKRYEPLYIPFISTYCEHTPPFRIAFVYAHEAWDKQNRWTFGGNTKDHTMDWLVQRLEKRYSVIILQSCNSQDLPLQIKPKAMVVRPDRDVSFFEKPCYTMHYLDHVYTPQTIEAELNLLRDKYPETHGPKESPGQ